MIHVLECSPREFKDRLAKLKAKGKIRSIATEPSAYRYTITTDEKEPVKTKKEVWADIPGHFFGAYQVSNRGRLRSVKIIRESDGEPHCLLSYKGKRKTTSIRSLMKLAGLTCLVALLLSCSPNITMNEREVRKADRKLNRQMYWNTFLVVAPFSFLIGWTIGEEILGNDNKK